MSDEATPPAHSAWAGGPIGRYGVRATRGVDRLLVGTFPLALAAGLTVLVALLRLQSCLASGWDPKQAAARMCTSDLATSVQVDSLGRGLTAYLTGDVHIAHPPVTAMVMALLGGFTDTEQLLVAQRGFVIAWALLAVVLLALLAARVAAVPGGQPSQVIFSPVVPLTVLVAPDLVGAALAGLGLCAWLGRRPLLTGVLLGAGTMARTWPAAVLCVLVAVLVSGRAPSRRTDLVPLLGGAAVALAGTALLTIAHPANLVDSWLTWWQAPTGLGSVWHVASLAGFTLPVGVATALALLGWLAAAALVGLALGDGGRPNVAALSLIAVAVLLVTGKSFPVQASLALVPLAALAGVRWRDQLIWAACEAAHFVALHLYLSGLLVPAKGLPVPWYVVFVLVRLAGIAWLAQSVWPTPPISGYAAPPGTLDRLPSACGKPPSALGDAPYPPVTERP